MTRKKAGGDGLRLFFVSCGILVLVAGFSDGDFFFLFEDDELLVVVFEFDDAGAALRFCFR